MSTSDRFETWRRRWFTGGSLLGLLVLVAALVAVAAPLVVAFSGKARPSTALACLLLVLAAGVLASRQWLRTSLRIFALLAIVSMVVLANAVGAWDTVREAECQVREVRHSVADVTAEQSAARKVARTSQREAVRDLQRVIDSTPARDLRRSLAGLHKAIRSGQQANVTGALRRVRAVPSADKAVVAPAEKAATAFRTAHLPERRATAAKKRVVDGIKEARRGSFGACGGTDPVRVSDPVPELARLDVLLAKYRVAAIGDTASAKALTEAQEAFRDARLTRDRGVNGSDLLDQVSRGGSATVSGLTRHLPLAPKIDRWVWLVLGALLLLFWWWIERRSNAQVAGPVALEFTPSDPADKSQQATFEAAITKNMRDPGSTPGASGAAITDLGSLVSADPTTILKALFTALAWVFKAPRGAKVQATVRPDGTGARVLVRVLEQSGGRVIATREWSGKTAEEACRTAGYWAAAVVLNRSTRIPSWTSWSAGTAKAFARYETNEEPTLKDLREAVAKAPSSGLLLQACGDKLALDRRNVAALEMYARAVMVDPTHFNARYRMGATLVALAHDPGTWWSGNNAFASEQRTAARLAVRAAFERVGLEHPTTLAAPSLGLAQTWTAELNRAVAARSAWWLLLRRDQRDLLWRSRKHARERTPLGQFRAMVRASALCAYSPGAAPAAELKSVTRIANRPRTTWHAPYNLACYYARAGDTSTSLSWLETAVVRPRAEELKAEWLSADPDLGSVASTRRFKHVLRLLGDKNELWPDPVTPPPRPTAPPPAPVTTLTEDVQGVLKALATFLGGGA